MTRPVFLASMAFRCLFARAVVFESTDALPGRARAEPTLFKSEPNPFARNWDTLMASNKVQRSAKVGATGCVNDARKLVRSDKLQH